MIKKNTIFSIGFLLALAFLSIASVSALTPINDTQFFTSTTNYTVYVNQTIWLHSYNVTSTQIQIYNLTVNRTTQGAKFENVNATYPAVIEFYNLNNPFNDVKYSNGTILKSTSSTLNRNVTIPVGAYILIGDYRISSILLSSPEQGTQKTDGIINFIFTPYDENNISNCSLMYGSGITYRTISNVTNNQQAQIEVVSVNNQHVLYSDNLQWYISCTDELGNIENSEVRSLDTKADSTGGTAGGGTTTTTTTSGDNTTSSEDPKYFNVNYPDTWNKGSTVTVKISAYNQSNVIYSPKAVKFEFAINGIVLEQTGTNANKEIVATFKVLNSAEVGQKTIKVIVEDERTVSQEMKFVVDSGIEVTTISGEKTTIDNFMWYTIWAIVGLLVLIFFVILLVALTRDAKR